MTVHGRVSPGWSENPTAWPKRIRLILLAFVGFCIASYLTLYQLGVFTEVWDPFFPGGSPKVLHLMEPLPDAALGALAYLTEILLSLIGGEDRWRTAPWTVLALGFVIVCGALVSVVLVIVQPVVAGAWCALCLASAFVSFAIFGLGVKEPLAALQYLRRVRASGASIRRAFWGLDGRQAMFGIRREGKG
jgi:Vitamin K epoxide reductase family